MRCRQIVAAVALGVLLSAAAVAAAPSGWHEPGNPEGGAVLALDQGADGTFYAGTPVGVFSSADGVTWQRGGSFPGVAEDTEATGLDATSGRTVYAVAGGALFRSDDAGASRRRLLSRPAGRRLRGNGESGARVSQRRQRS
jgi:hypothetical protein